MNERNIEIRSFDISLSDGQSRHITGYSVVFNTRSRDLGGFYEIIAPTAITQDLIDRSDVVMNYAHDDNLILARSRNGEGTLTLTLDDNGLRFDFDMPDTSIGNQVLESIRRGDVSTCSFAFSINDENCETWERDADDNIIRTITSITGLYDCAIVTHAAYEATTVSARSLDKINELNDMKQQDIELREDEKIEDEETEKVEDVKDEEENQRAEQDEDDEQQDEEQSEDTSSEEQEDEQQDSEEDEDDEENRSMKKTNKINTRNSKTMEKKFSLLKAIREAANGQKFDDATQAVVNAGAKAMRDAGQSYSGQIQLPVAEMREDPQPVHYTVDADGQHVVVTDYLNILEPLKAKNVLVNAGATYLTGLQGNLQIPSMTAENVYWEGEIDETENGAGSFSHVTMAPRRLSAFIDISKQFLVQDTLGAENLIRKLLVEAINDKLEETILSDDASSGAKPAGLFYNVSPTEIADYSDLCDFESDLEDANFTGEMKYVLSPKAKAALRSMIKGTNATGMIMENNAVDGTAVEVTTNIESGNLAYGDWSNLYIGQWGGIDLTVDNFTQATKGCVRLVINAFFDYKVVRDGAIVYGEIKTGSNS